MNSFTRIKLGLRSVLVELPFSTYISTTLITLAVLGLFWYFRWTGNFVSHPDQLLFVYPEVVLGIFSSLALIPAFFISISFFTKRFKHGGRAEDFLLLPLSNGERFSLSLVFSWIVVPLITYLPVLLLFIATSVVGHGYLVGPSALYLTQICLWSIVIYYALSIFWLFPAIAVPKFTVLVVFGLIGLSVAASVMVQKVLPPLSFEYTIDGSVFEDPGVVGMHEVASYHKPTPREQIDFSHDHEEDSMSYLPMLLASPFLLLAAFRAITRKQA